MSKTSQVFHKPAVHDLLLALSICTDRSTLAQSPSTYVSSIATKAGIVLEPLPHLQGTSLLTLPPDVALPEEMTSPKQGSI